MSIAEKIQETRIKHISITKESITAKLIDERTISVPLALSWRLSEATLKQKANWKIIGDGQGVHWPGVDEDISAEGMKTSDSHRSDRETVSSLSSESAHDAGPVNHSESISLVDFPATDSILA